MHRLDVDAKSVIKLLEYTLNENINRPIIQPSGEKPIGVYTDFATFQIKVSEFIDTISDIQDREINIKIRGNAGSPKFIEETIGMYIFSIIAKLINKLSTNPLETSTSIYISISDVIFKLSWLKDLLDNIKSGINGYGNFDKEKMACRYVDCDIGLCQVEIIPDDPKLTISKKPGYRGIMITDSDGNETQLFGTNVTRISQFINDDYNEYVQEPVQIEVYMI